MVAQISNERWNDYILFQFNGLIKTLELSHHEDLAGVIQYIAQEFQPADDKVSSTGKIEKNPKKHSPK